MSSESCSDSRGGDTPSPSALDGAAASVPGTNEEQPASNSLHEDVANGMKLPISSAGTADNLASAEPEQQQLQNSVASSDADTPLGGDDHLQNSTVFRETVQRLGDTLPPGYVDMDEHDSGAGDEPDLSPIEPSAREAVDEAVDADSDGVDKATKSCADGEKVESADEDSSPRIEGAGADPIGDSDIPSTAGDCPDDAGDGKECDGAAETSNSLPDGASASSKRCEQDTLPGVKQDEVDGAYQKEPQSDVATEPGINSSVSSSQQLTAASADGGNLSSTAPIASSAMQSTPRSKRRKPPTKTTIPLKSATPDTSLLSRGMSLFARSSNQMRQAGDNDADSVVSEMTQNTKSAKPAPSDRSDDDALRDHLEESGLILLRRLIEFLSECPPAPGEAGNSGGKSRLQNGSPPGPQKRKQRGLTLPASALGWLSSQITGSSNDAFDGIADCYRVPLQQLEVVETLFKRVASIRISGEAWPPPHASNTKANAATPEKGGISTRILSKFGADQTVDENIADDESCSTAPSRAGTTDDPEISVSPFRRYYHELQYHPDVNMSFFPNATKVVIDGIPPNWVRGLESLQSLDMFQMEKGCILDINQLFFPSDIDATTATTPSQAASFGLRRDLSLIEEGKEDEGLQSLPDNDAQPENASPMVYSSLTKLRLSNCAMGEAAGLRGRSTPKSVPRLPTLARFPNLICLNLSRNELFKSKTVFAGLSALPLLSWIDLSYNRLSSLDDIFMHVGNVTELILTGNEISSTRGLDRLFSLERLSLDENKIHRLADIAGVAKLPFLTNFDLKGNPMMADDPASCRIKVFNLFRDVRCSNLPKNATFRDMQRLLPILDKELATKDELVALKDLTFRQTVMPGESMLSAEKNDGVSDAKTVDESSEVSINMPTTQGVRHITKSSLIGTAHMRLAGSASLEKKADGRLERFHNSVDSRSISFLVDNRAGRKGDRRQLGVQFNFNELVQSIRPDVYASDASFVGVRDRHSSTGLLSFASHQVEAEAIAGSPAAVFPFGLPLDLLAEADKDVWDPPTRLDKILPSDTIVWEPLPGGNEEGLAEEIDAAISDDKESVDDETYHHSNDDQQPPRQGEESEDLSTLDPSQTDKDGLPRTSMFDDIWEETYRDNVAKDKKPDTEDPSVSKEKLPESIDFNAAEQNAVYDGPSDYGSLFVSSDLDLYFDSFIFHGDSNEGDSREIISPRIQLFKFDRDQLLLKERSQHGDALSSRMNFRERYIGVWREDVLACGSYARSRLPPMKLAKRGFHGDAITHAGRDVMISESRKFILCLSDSALYFIIDDDAGAPKSTLGAKRKFPTRIPPKSTFSDACWPHAVMRHPLDCLRGITIGFQFQRLILRFSVRNAASSSALEYAYVILTSNKLRTVSLLQKLQAQVSGNPIGMDTLIDNDDKSFLDALGAPRSNEVVLHYQILHQIWKRGDREASRRAFVLTDSRIYLLDELYIGDGTQTDDDRNKSKKLGSVSLSIIDSAKLSRVTEVRAANEDPRKITLVILSQNKLKRSHRWRLVCGDGEGAERLIEDVRRAIRAAMTADTTHIA